MADQSDVQQFLKPGETLIFGHTVSGKRFRPSDWAERLAGVMAQFKPSGARHREHHLCYSPYCMPILVNGERCIVLSPALAEIEPRAYRFVLNFARDNDLETVEACVIDPETEAQAALAADIAIAIAARR